MIRIRHLVTGEIQHVASIDGAGEDWEQVGSNLPGDAPWDGLVWDGGEWVRDPQVARDQKWAAAQAFYAGRCGAGFELEGFGVIQANAISREAILLLYEEARDQIDAGNPGWTTGFKNEANEVITATAAQVILIRRALRAFLGICWNICQAKRDSMDAILASNDGVADKLAAIDAIDISAGYPAAAGGEG